MNYTDRIRHNEDGDFEPDEPSYVAGEAITGYAFTIPQSSPFYLDVLCAYRDAVREYGGYDEEVKDVDTYITRRYGV